MINKLKQFYKKWDDYKQTLKNSTESKRRLLFSGLDLGMCQKIEALLGKQTVEHKNPDTQKISLHGRSLMTADEIRRLDRSRIIYIFSNERPFLLPTKWYES